MTKNVNEGNEKNRTFSQSMEAEHSKYYVILKSQFLI